MHSYSRLRFVVSWAFSLSAVHLLTPWVLAQFAHRRGWSGGWPGWLNLPALVLIAVGIAVVVAGLREHFFSKQEWNFDSRLDFPACPFTNPTYLVRGGIYQHTRNPMYVGAIAIWAGWAWFYGSITVMAATAVMWLGFEFFQIPREERRLMEAFGESYEAYKARVPRWLA